MVRIALSLVFIMMFVGTIACDCHAILHLDKTDQSDKTDQPDLSDQSDQPDQPDQSDKTGQSDQPDQPDQSDKTGQSDQKYKRCMLDIINTGFASLGGGATLQGIFSYIGFSSSGPVAGSIAAGLQSTIGNVASGSLFAAAQSLGMTTVAGLAAPAAIGAGIGGGAYFTYEMLKCLSESDN
jgi:hypothetical protein